MKRKRLHGLRVLVTRPEHQAEPLCKLIEGEGGKAIRLPLLIIAPPQDPASANAVLAQAGKYDWAIFTSINAVQQGLALRAANKPWPPQRACVGAGTARALGEAGLDRGLVPDSGASSEDLLALPAMHDMRGKRVLIVKGEGGRDLVSRTLASRGAQVDLAEVYRRVPAEIAPAKLEKLVVDVDVIVITSGEALEHLASLAGNRSHLFTVQLVVPSRRVVQLAQELGFICTPLVPEHISDGDIVNTLHDFHRQDISH
jgi:uroporphyrinogen-III synthase